MYYKPTEAAPRVQDRFEKPIKAMIDQDPLVWLSHGSRFVELQQEHGAAHLSNQRLASQATAHWLSPTRASHAIGGPFAR
jgi:hypothetical protein